MRILIILAALGCLLLGVWACPQDQLQNGCKIVGNTCSCGYGCKTEYIYRTRRTCLSELAAASSCGPDQSQYGCKIDANTCTCGYGCKNEYVYRTRHSCLNSIRVHRPFPKFNAGESSGYILSRERSSNICSRMPCIRGICTQTVQEPGFTCKCEGTGYYGTRCERACPVTPLPGAIFPHECIII